MDLVKKHDSSWKMAVTCTGYQCSDYPCFSELIVEKEDIVLLRDYPSAYGFICPNCHQFTKIDANLLPYSVKANAIKIAEKYGAFYDSYLGELKDPITEKQKKLCETVIATDYGKKKKKEKKKE